MKNNKLKKQKSTVFKGTKFEKFVKKIFEEYFSIELYGPEPKLIGKPGKNHKFDLVSNKKFIIECKNYDYTKYNNIPSAKIATLNEAVLFFKLLGNGYKKIIVMKKSSRLKNGKTLAEYYYDLYYFVLDGIELFEISKDGRIRDIKNNKYLTKGKIGA